MTDIKLKHVLLLAAAIPLAVSAQTELTYTEAKTLYVNKTKKEVSILHLRLPPRMRLFH